MKLELTVIELGKVLKKIEENYKLDLLVKSKLSGGWMTMIGQATINKVPTELGLGCSNKGNNIINIKVNDNSKDGSMIKLTGTKDKKFNVDISSTRYRELSKNSLNINQIKVNINECKLRIDENIIFTIKASADDVVKIIE
ncbi:UDP-N-acetylglucosamine pyrophosphorylase [Clostridium uliginosum]|uniref:Uncharacterized protein n=1 Tax=Clostridium uliginosum TaxID=119641 RepID=A0A1I1KCL2_9CLOT|nr:UDP-N-acetylglucosamine pyrophosphorylase [Clostridium uliginosum]SFC55833.1 hypothetical protein SAMN05421842_10567 [Clostridium uliginosum]